MEDLKTYLKAGTTKRSFGPKTDQIFENLSISSKKRAEKYFLEVFRLSFWKRNGHILSPASQYHTSMRILDPRQLPALDHDIQVHSNFLRSGLLIQGTEKKLSGILRKYGFKGPSPMQNYNESIWMPATSVDVEGSFSNYAE